MVLEKEGYFSDLMIPISIVAAVQAALLISLKENGAPTGSAADLLGYTVALLVYTFVGHSIEKFVPALIAGSRENHPRLAAKMNTGLTRLLIALRWGLFFLTVVILVLTTSEVANYHNVIFPGDR